MGGRLRDSSRIGGVASAAGVLLACVACGSSHSSAASMKAKTSLSEARGPGAQTASSRAATVTTSSSRPVAKRAGGRLIASLPGARRQGLFGWTPAVAVGGQTAVWISRVKAYHEAGFTITLLRFDQRLATLALDAGGSQPGGSGWRFGDAIGPAERRIVLAAFNSAFQESYGAGGFEDDIGSVGRYAAAQRQRWCIATGPPTSAAGRRQFQLPVGRWKRSDRISGC